MGPGRETPGMRVGLLGGTFNPIHVGHLLLAQEILTLQRLDEIWLIPNGKPPHRAMPEVTPEDRYMMTHLAGQEHDKLRVSRIEIEDPAQPYSFQTLARLKQQFPDHRYFFISGADAVLNYTWRNFDQLLDDAAGFIVASRPGSDWGRLQEKLAAENLAGRDKIIFQEMPLLDVSSTHIRERVAAGYSIRYYVTRAVEDYIVKRGLYKSLQGRKPQPA